jgi:hypothetical protein
MAPELKSELSGLFSRLLRSYWRFGSTEHAVGLDDYSIDNTNEEYVVPCVQDRATDSETRRLNRPRTAT